MILKKSYLTFLTLLFVSTLFLYSGCGKDNDNDTPEIVKPETVTDINGNVYQTVEIGDQLWMAENLSVTHYSNGDPVENIKVNGMWEGATIGAYSVYPHNNTAGIDSDEEMAAVYGVLYNWYAVADQRGLCPAGWRAPTDLDWQKLLAGAVEAVEEVTLNNLGDALKSCRQYESPLGGDCGAEEHPYWFADENHYGTDILGFGALPAGTRNLVGQFTGITYTGAWWSTDETDLNAVGRIISGNQGNVNKFSFWKQLGLSVRCVWEEE